MKPIFISGIGTGVGKTLASAVIVEKLKADYWKPVQSGDLENSDTMIVRNLVSNNKSQFFQEAFRLTQPFSPHKSAKLDKVQIQLNDFELPQTENQLVIEGAGGLMVPLNDDDLMIDLIKKFDAAVILIVQNYLGSINHSLLSIEALKTRNLEVSGLIFNGDTDEFSESIILHKSSLKVIGRLPSLTTISKKEVIGLADSLQF